MFNDPLPLDAARRVSPRALQGYTRGLGWQPVPNGKRPEIAIFQRPDSPLHQVTVPTDETLSDYAEAVAEAVRKLAEFENRPASEVLEHLLLPPADVLRFREVSPDADVGNLLFEHAVRMINGTRRLLLSAAHSVLVPQPSHPRLSRSEAEDFVNRCRLGQTERGSFVLNVACPLELPLTLPGIQDEPFARQVTNLLMRSLGALARAADSARADELLDPLENPGLSANLCESLLLLRPSGDRGTLTVSAVWSRALLPPLRESSRQVEVRQEVFEVAELVAPRLRTLPQPRPARFVGFVDALRGQPTRQDPRPSGEVDFTLFDDEQGEISARGLLPPKDYAIAGEAHLSSNLVAFKGTLRRLPRISRIDGIADFEMVDFHDEVPEPPAPANQPAGSSQPPPAMRESTDIPF
jgi:hypothetical protein